MLMRFVLVILFALVCARSAFPQTSTTPDNLTADALASQVIALDQQGRFLEAIPLAERWLALLSKSTPPKPLAMARAERRLAALYWNVGKYGEAERHHKNALEGFRAALGEGHAEVAASLNYLGDTYRDSGDFARAETHFKEALEIIRSPKGETDMIVGTIQNSLGRLYRKLGRYQEAEALYNEALVVREAKYGAVNRHVGETVNNLGVIHHLQRRHATAEQYYRRSIEIKEAVLSSDHIEVGRTLNNLAALLGRMKRFKEAEPIYRRALAIRKASLGPNHAEVGQGYNNLALNLRMQRKFEEAAEYYQSALKVRQAALGQDHPDVADTMHNIAAMYREIGRHDDADPLYDQALEIYANTFVDDHEKITGTLMHKSRLVVDRKRWPDALALLRRAAKNHANDARREASARRPPSLAHLTQRREDLGFLTSSLYRAKDGSGVVDDFAREAFQVAQQALSSSAAIALLKLANRHAAGDGDLAKLLRDRQDHVMRREAANGKLTGLIHLPASRRDRGQEEKIRRQMSDLDDGIRKIDDEIADRFADFSRNVAPRPVSLKEVRENYLGDDEALILFFDLPSLKPFDQETFIWVVTKNDLRWVRSEIGTKTLKQEVAALRCGLDPSAWSGKKAKACAERVGIPLTQAPKSGEPLPFDVSRAHKLYTALFGEVEDLMKGKQLLIVPSGPLTQLPFHALVTEPPTSNDMSTVAWLAKRHAITVLPAVSSLKALRAHAKTSSASKPFVGFGNPLLDGNLADSHDIKAAKQARTINGCAKAGEIRTASLRSLRGVGQIKLRGLRVADRDDIAIHAPLPETADELCRIARAVGANLNADIHLGAKATETTIKAMNKAGTLSRYKVLSFATHGATAGQLIDAEEPGLILTPPEEDASNKHDDGYLSASEIADLKLDADWVILSACNTASGEAANAEALSGMARAFFYAGARALLVSHWSVYSSAAIELVTGAFEELKANAKIGRAEALRLSMLRLIAQGGKRAHPSYWAPFVVVGEGGAGR